MGLHALFLEYCPHEAAVADTSVAKANNTETLHSKPSSTRPTKSGFHSPPQTATPKHHLQQATSPPPPGRHTNNTRRNRRVKRQRHKGSCMRLKHLCTQYCKRNTDKTLTDRLGPVTRSPLGTLSPHIERTPRHWPSPTNPILQCASGAELLGTTRKATKMVAAFSGTNGRA